MKGNGSPPKRRKQSVHLVLGIKALSVNKLYKGIKERSHYYKKFRREVFQTLNGCSSKVNLSGNLTFCMEVGFSSPLSDLSNAMKAIEDVLSEYFGFNDRQIVRIELDKLLVNKGDEYMKITIKKSRKNIDRREKKCRK